MVAAQQTEDTAPMTTQFGMCREGVGQGCWSAELNQHPYPDLLEAPVLGEAKESGDYSPSNGEPLEVFK